MSHEMTHPFTHSLSRAHVPFHVLLSVPHSMSPPGSHHMLHNISRTVSIPMSYWLSHIPCLITCPMKSPILCPCTRVPLPYPILCPMSMSHSHIAHFHANFQFNVIVFFNSYSNVFYIDWTHKCPKCIGQSAVYDRTGWVGVGLARVGDGDNRSVTQTRTDVFWVCRCRRVQFGSADKSSKNRVTAGNQPTSRWGWRCKGTTQSVSQSVSQPISQPVNQLVLTVSQ